MKLRSALVVGTAFATGLLVGPTLGRFAEPTFGTALAQEATSDDHAETYRLLTLFGTVLDLVRARYVEPVSDKELINNALQGMVGGLDPHSSYMTPQQFEDMHVQTSGEFGGLGLEVQSQDGHIRVVSPIDGTPAARAGVKPGDFIVALDGKNVDGLPLDDAVTKMRGKPGTKITLTLIREHTPKPVIVTMTREIIHAEVVRSRLLGQVAYIRVAQFNEETDDKMRQAFETLKRQAGGHLTGLVLDLRSDPGGLLNQAIAVASDFIPQGAIVSTRARNPAENQRWDASGHDITDKLPIVVLINSGTASASEIVAGALQDHRRAVLLGEKSFGKGSVQTLFPLSGGGGVRLTTARYYTPSGRSIQGLGIVPDILVRESRTDPGFSIREADLAHTIKNSGGNETKATTRTDLPPIAAHIPDQPPANWPSFDPDKPKTDFQLQEGLRVLASMSGQPVPPEPTAPADATHH